MLTAIVGINWGDEGKGRMVDLLSRDHHIVVRYQGDNRSEHTIVADGHRYLLSLLPAGILRPDVVCVMGNGMVIDPTRLASEIDQLMSEGILITPDRLKISDRAFVELPHHRRPLTESSPVYGDKAMNRAIRMCDLLQPEYLADRLGDLFTEETRRWAADFGTRFAPYLCDTGIFLAEADRLGMDILFEAPQGALRDVDFGIYPYTCSSSTVAAYATIGAGVPGLKLDHTIGIMKSFSSMVGKGPFPAELDGGIADMLMETGNEAAVKDGHDHRVGAFDAVASRYGVRIQGADELALTKLDTLSYLTEIPVCVAYEINGVVTEAFPQGADLEIAKPVMEYVSGWNIDISECRTADDLPVEALTYVKYLEHLVGAPITYISVGAEREAYIKL